MKRKRKSAHKKRVFPRWIFLSIFLLLCIIVGTLLLSRFTSKSDVLGDQTTTVGNIYTGVTVNTLIPNNPINFTPLLTFEKNVIKKPSILLYYQSWDIGKGGRVFDTNLMNAIHQHGSIPMVAWYSQENGTSNQAAYQTKNIYNGKYDSYIKNWAYAAKSWGYPFFLRFDSEMNGNWTPWCDCSNGNKKGDYVKAWQHVHDIFTRVGATNVTWVWDVNVEQNGINSINYIFPGDTYVDWVGMNGYNWGNIYSSTHWQSFYQIFHQTYQNLQKLTSKPIMIGEMGSAESGGNKASWIMDAFMVQLPLYFPKIRAITWFNLNKETDWRIESSTASQQAFRHVLQTKIYATNSFASNTVSPLAPLSSITQTTLQDCTSIQGNFCWYNTGCIGGVYTQSSIECYAKNKPVCCKPNISTHN